MDAELKAYLEGMEYAFAKTALKWNPACAAPKETETKLLREFWKWARTADARYRQHQAEVSVLDESLSVWSKIA